MPTQTDQFSEFMQSISPGYKSPVKKEFTKEELEQLNNALPKNHKTYLESIQKSENPYSAEYYKKVAEEERIREADKKKAREEDRKKRVADDELRRKNGPQKEETWREMFYNDVNASDAKYRVSQEDNIFDDYINPAAMIGGMVKNLGQAPLVAKETDSNMPYVTAVATPLAVGAVGGIGAKTSGQAFNNAVNPLAGIGGIPKTLEGLKRVGTKKIFDSRAAGIEENIKRLELLTSPKTLKAVGNLDAPIANEMLNDYMIGKHPSVKQFRLDVKKATLIANREKKLNPTLDFSKDIFNHPDIVSNYNDYLLSKPEYLPKFIEEKKAAEKTINNRQKVVSFLEKDYVKKMDLINQSPLLKNIAQESPQYINEIYSYLKNPAKPIDEFVNDLVRESNTFTRALRNSMDAGEISKTDFFTPKGSSMGYKGKNTIDVEGFPISGNYGVNRYKISPNEERMADIANTPIEERWAKRIPSTFTGNENVDFGIGLWSNVENDFLHNAIEQRKIRNSMAYDNSASSVIPKSIKSDILPHKYLYNPKHIVFNTPEENAFVKGFNIEQVSDWRNPFKNSGKFRLEPGYTKGFQKGGIIA